MSTKIVCDGCDCVISPYRAEQATNIQMKVILTRSGSEYIICVNGDVCGLSCLGKIMRHAELIISGAMITDQIDYSDTYPEITIMKVCPSCGNLHKILEECGCGWGIREEAELISDLVVAS